ncbi:MAG: MFS transporter [Clostridia bacterium]|nr:MFS transporter [Clostridia bacterium]
MDNNVQYDQYKKSRFLHIIEAALEYFIAILVEGAFLARITAELGISDSLTGILTAFVQLGNAFQLTALFINTRKPVKRWITVGQSINQLAFGIIYVTPFLKVSSTSKTVIFIIALVIGHILNQIAFSPKNNWYMRLVENNRRGRFTAIKEIVSLIGGMVFSLSLGRIMDHFDAIGNKRESFAVCAICIFVLALLHSLTLIFSKERAYEITENEEAKKESRLQSIKSAVSDKNIIKIIIMFILWNAFRCMSYPFYGSYQINELGFSMTFVSILSIVYAVVRSLFSIPLGRFADKNTFAKMLMICFPIEAIGWLFVVFCVPSNGKILFTLYKVFEAISMAGINSAGMNLIFDFADESRRTESLALKNSLCGIAGFLSTLAISPLITYIQANNNRFLGINAYAQQVVSAFSFVGETIVILYLIFVVSRLKKQKENE